MEPGIIKKLDEVVVNRIAAGEIIQRPANALKELIENSLDAKSTYIQVTVKSGGLKLLQIQDNGTGIRKEDLAIVCERFTTSKLTKFEDLTQIATYGFRGEALASISHVAHFTIQTKTANEKCGYKASYEDGKLKDAPKPCAGNQGTIITIEDLFYNMPQRKQAFKSANEEFQRISEVVSKYAVHNACVGFMLKKYGEQPSLKTAAKSTHQLNIQTIYGNNIAKDLMPVELQDNVHKFKMNGLITKVNYQAKKGIMLLFINHRLVDSVALKSAIDSVYSLYLPKGTHPFIYISVELEPSNVDVNVHPTKHEVHFLYEDEIIEKIKLQIEKILLGSNSTRTFYKQLKLPGVSSEDAANDDSAIKDNSFKTASGERIAAKDMIRTDNKEQKLFKFLNIEGISSSRHSDSGCSSPQATLSGSSCISNGTADESFRETAARKSKEVRLTSVLNMQKKIENSCSVQMRKIIKEMVFVGVVNKNFALFQHETKLYLANTKELSKELYYQRLVYEFQNLPIVKIKPEKLSIRKLILLALNSSESGYTDEDGDKEELADRASEILVEKSAIMKEYFSLHITVEGDLEALPSILEQHGPSKTYLPLYMLRLATEVEWDSEAECFETFSRETANYYSLITDAEFEIESKRLKWLVEHVIYPGFKKYLLPSDRIKKDLYELTNLSALYKVFERC